MRQKVASSLSGQRNIQLLIFFIGLFSIFNASATLNTPAAPLKNIGYNKNTKAFKRLRSWHKLIQTTKHLSEKEKLRHINNFFNQRIRFTNDIDLWGVNDYWATPQEFLAKGAGDCEDYSIAKYYSLIKLGIPKNKLRITYVKILKYNQAHMVLAYFSSPQTTPVILDNLIPEIKTIKQRKDLFPLFNFNESGLWVVDLEGNEKKMGGLNKYYMWAELQKRLSRSMI